MVDRERRATIQGLVERERGEHLLSVHLSERARADAIERADRWSRPMVTELKRFGDGVGNNYLKHFVFDSENPLEREHHRFVHSQFRGLVGVEFVPLGTNPGFQTVVGQAELYAWGSLNAQGHLQTATYEAIRPKDAVSAAMFQRLPFDLSSL